MKSKYNVPVNKIDFRSPGLSPFSATLLAVVMFFIYTTGYALRVFVQFTSLQILSVGLTCAGLLIALTALFMRPSLFDFHPGLLRVNLKTVASSLFITFVLIMFAHNTFDTTFMFARTFPLLETELGLGWHQDTVFHVSLIQSILNFGYPSIAQHGHPLAVYHVLSHYVDALILFITRVDPYDSYGLLFHYKIFLFLSSILLAVTAMTRNHGSITYFVSFVLLAPCIISNWPAIGSYGLWMASLILILSAPFVFSRLFQEENLTHRQLVALFLIIVSIGLAKISNGLMYGALLGLFILFKQTSRISTYLFGGLLLIFFLAYGYSFSLGDSECLKIDFTRLSFTQLYNYLKAKEIVRSPLELKMPSEIPGILTCTTILLVILVSRVQKNSVAAFFSAVVGLGLLYIVTESNSGYIFADVWYFQYALLSGMILLTFASVLHYKNGFTSSDSYRKAISDICDPGLAIAAIVCLALLSKYTTLCSFNIFNVSPAWIRVTVDYANTNPFALINKKLPPTEQITVNSSLNEKKAVLKKLSVSRPLLALQQDIANILAEHKLSKKKTALLLSKDYFDNQFIPFDETLSCSFWSRGLMIYAVTGVQLLYGVTELPKPRGYGITSYYKHYRALPDQLIDEDNICKSQDIVDSILLYTSKHNGLLIKCKDTIK